MSLEPIYTRCGGAALVAISNAVLMPRQGKMHAHSLFFIAVEMEIIIATHLCGEQNTIDMSLVTIQYISVEKQKQNSMMHQDQLITHRVHQ